MLLIGNRSHINSKLCMATGSDKLFSICINILHNYLNFITCQRTGKPLFFYYLESERKLALMCL